ncbi:MAG: ABC transporter ATP-binding protein [Ignavibacteriaceae bacterium]|nr:ABC transporter ATP-binding protein [Ignavibacteriaceae bacterium]
MSIKEGEFFCLLGPSGCGKTTLLRLIAGFEFPGSGKILLNGEDISLLPPNKRDINLVFQNYALFPHLNVIENISYGLKIKKIDPSELESRTADIINNIGLTGLEKRMPSQLSGGQQQRVALARAVVNRPKLLLLDEPLSALDKKVAEQTIFELTDLQKKLGITFIYVTHNQHESLSLADRIALINNGQIEQIATPKELYEKPVSHFAADFIGKMNFFESSFEGRENGTVNLKLPDNNNVQLHTTEKIDPDLNLFLCIRPEKLSISKTIPEDNFNSLKCRLKHIIYMGDSIEFEVVTEKGKPVFVKTYGSGRFKDSESYIQGEEYYLVWEKKHGWLIAQ